ncbi:MAG: Hsp20/alpha crystallin family protein [Proteobacteria bacterium]|nr:Hsp20/alpha crystallin family protein [Pseudomonadota bacterium]
MAEHLPKPFTSGSLMPFGGDMEQFFNRMMRGWPFGWLDAMGASPSPALRAFESSPRVEVKENDNAYTLCVELPGLDQNDVKVHVDDGVLTISGEKKIERTDEKTHYSERSYGSFTRSFHLPSDAQADGISARYGKGVLTLEIPKAVDRKSSAKDIEIKPS